MTALVWFGIGFAVAMLLRAPRERPHRPRHDRRTVTTGHPDDHRYWTCRPADHEGRQRCPCDLARARRLRAASAAPASVSIATALVEEVSTVATTIACPHCNRPLTASVTLDRAPRAAEQLSFEQELPAGVAIARPFPGFRGDGYQRMRQWGTVTDSPTHPGAQLQIVSKRGKTWRTTVDQIVRTDRNGHLVTLCGRKCQPAPVWGIPRKRGTATLPTGTTADGDGSRGRCRRAAGVPAELRRGRPNRSRPEGAEPGRRGSDGRQLDGRNPGERRPVPFGSGGREPARRHSGLFSKFDFP